jgi:hypothetical protein
MARSSRALSSSSSINNNNHLFFTGNYVSNNKKSIVAPSRSFQLSMTSTVAAATTTTSPRRVKTVDAVESDEQVSIKGWVKTVRKQKTLAFVEVNDGSNMNGIQCVLPFDSVDENTMKGKRFSIFGLHLYLSSLDTKTIHKYTKILMRRDRQTYNRVLRSCNWSDHQISRRQTIRRAFCILTSYSR